MATTKLGETPVNTNADLPAIGSRPPEFTLTGPGFRTVSRTPGMRTVLNTFPSVDTGTCSASVRRFNELVGSLDNTEVICASMDLPWAIERFCGAEGIENVQVASTFRSTFGQDYGVHLVDGLFESLLARAIIVLDTDGTVIHTQLVSPIGIEPDYDAAVAALA
jgi:thioredoxin-dependent peroxiredoxin